MLQTATGRGGERVTSSPGGINVSTGSTGSATFASVTSVTLSVTNGRDAIWSGACSSGGNTRKTCTFTLAGTAAVTAVSCAHERGRAEQYVGLLPTVAG
jgi:hypothetical protein